MGPIEYAVPGRSLRRSGYAAEVHVFVFESLVAEIAYFAVLGMKLFAFVDALTRRADAFPAADKLTKPAWLLILGITVAAALVFPSLLGIISILGIVAALVYLVDVRPALSSVTRRR